MDLPVSVEKKMIPVFGDAKGRVNADVVELGVYGSFEPGCVAFLGFVGQKEPSGRWVGVLKFGKAPDGPDRLPSDFAFLAKAMKKVAWMKPAAPKKHADKREV